MTAEQSYIFDAGAAEEAERLLAQGAIGDPMTRRFFVEAGLAPGMRVLDLGSGAGNVAVLAAELVGPGGSVVGVRVADVQALAGVEAGFDAVVGRFILMYQPDPVATLRQAVSRLRPGGVVCLHEVDATPPWAYPEGPTWRRAHTWVLDAFAKAGVNERMGLALNAVFRAAGLPHPRMRLEAFIGGGPDAPTWVAANLVEGMLPLMERLGVATRDEVDPADLADRMLAELAADDGVMVIPLQIGAWATAS